MKWLFTAQFLLLFNLLQAQTNWEKINGPLYPATPYSFLITSTGTQFVGTDNTGLFRSTDGGQTWELKNNNLSGNRITALAEAPNSWIYAGSAWSVAKCLSRSTDNGESWQRMIESDANVRSIEFNSFGHIYVGTEGAFFRSTNNGVSWSIRNNGLINTTITSIEVVFDTILFITTNDGIYKSFDYGDNWISINGGVIPSGQANSIIFNNDTLYSSTKNAVYVSTNFGDQWVQRSSISSEGYLQIGDQNIFYLRQGIQQRLLRSYDYGSTWNVAFTFPDKFVYFKVENEEIYASSYAEGLYISSDSGNTFQEYFVHPFLQPTITFFKIIEDTMWFAGTSAFSGTAGFGVFFSNDKGLNWQMRGPLKERASHFQINSLGEIFVNCDFEVYKSSDFGLTWEMIAPPPFFPYDYLTTISISYNDEIFTAYNDGGIAKLNSNNTWDSLAYIETYNGSTLIGSIIVDKYDDSYLSVMLRTIPFTYYKTYKELDHFNSFQTIFNETSALAYNDSGDVFFGNSQMYRTTDRGITYELINNGITDLNAYSIKVIDNNEIYIGDYNKLYVSTNNGNQWYPIQGPSEVRGIHSIEKIGEGFLMVASDQGIYRNTNIVSVGTDGGNNILPNEFKLEQNYPNPFNPTTKIKYTIPTPPLSSPLPKGRTEEGFVTLKVYDVLGNEVATLVNEEKPAGTYEVEFNGKGLSSGVYFYRLQAGNKTITKKLTLLK